MVGVGKLLKQAQKMQQKMEEAQASLSDEILEVSGGGGAVSIKISGMGEFNSKVLELPPRDFVVYVKKNLKGKEKDLQKDLENIWNKFQAK